MLSFTTVAGAVVSTQQLFHDARKCLIPRSLEPTHYCSKVLSIPLWWYKRPFAQIASTLFAKWLLASFFLVSDANSFSFLLLSSSNTLPQTCLSLIHRLPELKHIPAVNVEQFCCIFGSSSFKSLLSHLEVNYLIHHSSSKPIIKVDLASSFA